MQTNRILILVLAVLGTALTVAAQETKELPLETRIEGATVFFRGAQVIRTGKLWLTGGKSVLVMKGLSPYIDEKSIQVRATGGLTVLSVNHRYDYLGERQKTAKADSLDRRVQGLDRRIKARESRREVLKEMQGLLKANQQLSGANSSLQLSQLRAALEFYEQELGKLKAEDLEIAEQLQELQHEKDRLAKQLGDLEKQRAEPLGEIVMRVERLQPGDAEFTVSYLVDNAGWFPKYDVRVDRVDKPLTLSYKAELYQQTGEDWQAIKLKFSNGNPSQTGLAPKLDTWYLRFASSISFQKSNVNNQAILMAPGSIRQVSGTVVDRTNGEPLPGVNVMVKGTTIGTVTDMDGRYSLVLPNNAQFIMISYIGYASVEAPITSERMDFPIEPDLMALEEVVVTGYGRSRALMGKAPGVNTKLSQVQKQAALPIATTTVENQTTVEFEIDEPYSVKSDGEKLSVELQRFEIEALYEYYVVPKLDPDAFLVARIADWDQYNLLEGEANLYFEDAYVGRSILETAMLTDTLSISLGRDRNIAVKREKIRDFSKARTLGGNRIETRGFELSLRNRKTQSIRIIMVDQLPVAGTSEISVNPIELSGGKHDADTGEVKWELNLQSQQQVSLKLQYEVRYPRRERVILE